MIKKIDMKLFKLQTFEFFYSHFDLWDIMSSITNSNSLTLRWSFDILKHKKTTHKKNTCFMWDSNAYNINDTKRPRKKIKENEVLHK